MALWLVCDASGSMVDGGKRLVVRGLVREVEQYFRLGYAPRTELKLVLWRDRAEQLPWQPGDEVPVEQLECKGSGNVSAVIQILGATAGDRYVILSDGYWTDEARREFERWRESLSDDALRVIKIGADANPRLTGPGVFESEDFFAVMDGWLAA